MGEIKIMTTKEVAALCGVTSRTVSGNARKAGVILEDGKTHNWTDEEIRRLKAVLISNQVRQGRPLEEIKSDLETACKLGALAKLALKSGNRELAEKLSKIVSQATSVSLKG